MSFCYPTKPWSSLFCLFYYTEYFFFCNFWIKNRFPESSGAFLEGIMKLTWRLFLVLKFISICLGRFSPLPSLPSPLIIWLVLYIFLFFCYLPYDGNYGSLQTVLTTSFGNSLYISLWNKATSKASEKAITSAFIVDLATFFPIFDFYARGHFPLAHPSTRGYIRSVNFLR